MTQNLRFGGLIFEATGTDNAPVINAFTATGQVRRVDLTEDDLMTLIEQAAHALRIIRKRELEKNGGGEFRLVLHVQTHGDTVEQAREFAEERITNIGFVEQVESPNERQLSITYTVEADNRHELRTKVEEIEGEVASRGYTVNTDTPKRIG